jgi:hypothetical protein
MADYSTHYDFQVPVQPTREDGKAVVGFAYELGNDNPPRKFSLEEMQALIPWLRQHPEFTVSITGDSQNGFLVDLSIRAELRVLYSTPTKEDSK